MTERGFDEALDDLRAKWGKIGAFVRRMPRFWRGPLSIAIAGAVACGVVLRLRAPTYLSKTVILYSDGVRVTDGADRPDAAQGVTLRLKEILMSRIALDVVGREFDLYSDVRRKLGPVNAAEELRRHVEFHAPGGDTFSIAFTGASPEEAARVTRRLGELVIEQNSDLRREQARVTRDFLEVEERASEATLRGREKELASFIAAHPRFALDRTPSSTGAAIRASLGATALGLSHARPGTALPSAGAVAAQTLVALETDWVRLSRGVTEASRGQDQLEAALFKANLSASSEASGHGFQMTVIDPAFLPRNAVPPSRTAIAALFAAFSFVLGMLTAVLRTAFDDRIYEVDDIATLSTILAELPGISPERERGRRRRMR